MKTVVFALLLTSAACAPTHATLEKEQAVKSDRDRLFKNDLGDLLSITKEGALIFESTRQVGGQGGLSNTETVPYPTVCRTIETGYVTRDSQESISYRVESLRLTEVQPAKDSEHCEEYLKKYNETLKRRSVHYTLNRSEFGNLIAVAP